MYIRMFMICILYDYIYIRTINSQSRRNSLISSDQHDNVPFRNALASTNFKGNTLCTESRATSVNFSSVIDSSSEKTMC